MSDRKRLPAAGREALNALFATHSIMAGYAEQFKRLCERIPSGWRDFRMVQTKIESMLDKLLDTIPQEQLQTIKHHLEISTIHLGVKGVRPKDYWLISYDDLADLAEHATKTECFACTKTDGPCRLREILKDLPIQGVSSVVVGCWKED